MSFDINQIFQENNIITIEDQLSFLTEIIEGLISIKTNLREHSLYCLECHEHYLKKDCFIQNNQEW